MFRPKFDKFQGTDLDAQYLAGLFDGEGTAGVYWVHHGGRPHWVVSTAIVMTDEEPVRHAANSFGGYVGVRSPRTWKSHRENKPMWTWRATGRTALLVAKTLRPYIRSAHRIRQFNLILNFFSTPGGLPSCYRGKVGRVSVPEAVA